MIKTIRKKNSDQDSKFLQERLGAVIHEINSPLDGIMRYVNLALTNAEKESVTKSYLEEAKFGLTNISKIIRSFSECCWSHSPGQDKIDVNCLIEESISAFKHYILSYNIEVKRFLAVGLPELPDYGLRLVFNNVIKNACEAMKNGGILTISTKINNKALEIRFEDTGGGIPLGSRARIFEPFFTTKSETKGSGLGLAISKEIVQSYKGIICVDYNNIKGGAFVIRLPISNGSYNKSKK